VPYAEVNGQRLYFEDTGGEGPPIVFSHGFLMDHRMFAPQVADLADVFRVITWDARGFGQTEFDGTPFSYWDAARDVFGLLDVLGIERAVLAGMSQGGYLSLRAALLQPDRVRALVLIDTQAPPESADKIAEYRAMIATWSEHGLRRGAGVRWSPADPRRPVLADIWKARWREMGPSSPGAGRGALLDRDDISDRLEELAMPVLCIHGSEDLAIPVAARTRSARPCPTAAGSSRCRARRTRRT
jgi:3-oxoadipate enol-lactonase